MIPLIVIGSITEDIIITPHEQPKHFIGGVPIYAAATAKALGQTIGIVSKVGTDFQLKNLKLINSLEPDLNGFKITGQHSMRFENKYNRKGKRSQKILSISDKITIKDIPDIYSNVPCVHLGPVFNELDETFIDEIRPKYDLISLDGQGFTRSHDKNHEKVILKPWENYEDYLPKIDILKVDDLEIKSITATNNLDKAIDKVLDTKIKLLVITLASDGAIIYSNNERFDIPAIPTKVVDETGAGDTFITAFLLEYLRTKDCYYSGLVAATAASFKIATSGPLPTYSREDIIVKLKSIQPEFEDK
ncbi:MAG: hypothetical protein FK734_17100 [Asgard group archaeon]|nr:hypothetical protein [Asgard group archaeon]